MAADLQFVEIPGYAAALRRESDLRRAAWVSPRKKIAGVMVRPLTLSDMEELCEMRNGFFCPWRFDSEDELIGHSAQLVWWLSDCPKPKPDAQGLFNFSVSRRRSALISHLAKNSKQMMDDVRTYLADSFMDAPKGDGSSSKGAIAGNPAYVFDTLAAGGYLLTIAEVMQMPLVQLWQILRLATRRLYDAKPTNESDRIACDYVAGLNAQRATGKN